VEKLKATSCDRVSRPRYAPKIDWASNVVLFRAYDSSASRDGYFIPDSTTTTQTSKRVKAPFFSGPVPWGNMNLSVRSKANDNSTLASHVASNRKLFAFSNVGSPCMPL